MTLPFMPGPGQSIQRLERTVRTFTDQHGREFEAMTDIRNNRPIGEFRPLGCMPPWLPPMRFIWWEGHNQLTFKWAYRQLADELSSHTAQWYSNARKMALKEKLPVPEVGGEVHQLIRDVFGNPGLSPEIPLSAELGDEWMLKGDGYVPRNEYLFGILNQGLLMQSNEALDIIEARVRERMGLPKATPNAPDRGIVAQAEALQRGPSGQLNGQLLDVVAPPKAYTYNEFAAECRAQGIKAPEIGALWQQHKRDLLGESTSDSTSEAA